MALIKFSQKELIEAGCDEAGRGCLAGPVFAAAVILGRNVSIKGLDDSKKLTAAKRKKLRFEIEEKALSYAVASCSETEIDQYNILNASFIAMHKAIEKLKVVPEFLIIDGNRFNPYSEIKYKCYVEGDARFQSIAAASILAKTYRDEYMVKIHQEHPYYGWSHNKGYPTKEHREAIVKNGISDYHRKSFKLFSAQLELFPRV